MTRRALVLALVIAALIAACDRVIDLSRRGPDGGGASDVGSPGDGGTDGVPGDGDVGDGGGGGLDA